MAKYDYNPKYGLENYSIVSIYYQKIKKKTINIFSSFPLRHLLMHFDRQHGCKITGINQLQHLSCM